MRLVALVQHVLDGVLFALTLELDIVLNLEMSTQQVFSRFNPTKKADDIIMSFVGVSGLELDGLVFPWVLSPLEDRKSFLFYW